MSPIPPPVSPESGPWELLAQLVDARWLITTSLALYAAVVSTFQAFIKERWLHKPRIVVKVTDGIAIGGETPSFRVIGVTVANHGYQPRRINDGLSFIVQEVIKDPKHKHLAFFATAATSLPRLPVLLAPTDCVNISSETTPIVYMLASNYGLSGTVHIKAVVYDGTGRRHESDWTELAIEAKTQA